MNSVRAWLGPIAAFTAATIVVVKHAKPTQQQYALLSCIATGLIAKAMGVALRHLPVPLHVRVAILATVVFVRIARIWNQTDPTRVTYSDFRDVPLYDATALAAFELTDKGFHNQSNQLQNELRTRAEELTAKAEKFKTAFRAPRPEETQARRIAESEERELRARARFAKERNRKNLSFQTPSVATRLWRILTTSKPYCA